MTIVFHHATSSPNFLEMPSGDRRFWVIEVGPATKLEPIDVEYLKALITPSADVFRRLVTPRGAS